MSCFLDFSPEKYGIYYIYRIKINVSVCFLTQKSATNSLENIGKCRIHSHGKSWKTLGKQPKICRFPRILII